MVERDGFEPPVPLVSRESGPSCQFGSLSAPIGAAETGPENDWLLIPTRAMCMSARRRSGQA
jgi:hypothetical protein